MLPSHSRPDLFLHSKIVRRRPKDYFGRSRTNGRFQEWLNEVRGLPVRLIMQKVSQKLRGPYGYYGVTDNYQCQCQGPTLPSLLLIRRSQGQMSTMSSQTPPAAVFIRRRVTFQCSLTTSLTRTLHTYYVLILQATIGVGILTSF